MKKAKEKAGITVPEKLQARANAVLETTHKAYWAKGGIADTQGKLESQRGTVSEAVFQLAKACKSPEMFKAACKGAEAHLIALHGKGKDVAISEVLPCWRQYKSNIIAAINKGLKLDQFDTESAMRKALQAKRKADKAAKGGEGNGEGKANLSPVAQALSELHETLSALPEAQALELVSQFRDLATAAAIELAGGEPAQEDGRIAVAD